MEEKKQNIIIILLSLIIVFLITLLGFIITDKKNNKKEDNKQNNNPTQVEENKQNNDTNQTNQEVDVAINDYKYLVERLEKVAGPFDLNDYLELNKMSDSKKVLTAIGGLKEEKINFKSDDQIDNDNKIEKIGDLLDTISGGYSVANVENEIKKIYGKNTIVKHKKAGLYVYDITAKAYFAFPSGYGPNIIYLQNINKITKNNNNIFIYVSVGYDDQMNDQICYDIKGKICTKKSSIDKKYLNSYVDSERTYTEVNKQQYMKDNQDKFEQYKYTFEKEDNNYIIKKLEKIN